MTDEEVKKINDQARINKSIVLQELMELMRGGKKKETVSDGCRTVVTEYMPAKDLIALFEYIQNS